MKFPAAARLTVTVRPRASWYSRAAAIGGIAVLLATLIVARQLEPNAAGFGTHRQLGLPPCTSIALWGMRCPACGMTTSWSLAMRGEWLGALSANAGGVALVVIAMAYAPAFCYYTARGYWSHHGWLSFSLALCLGAALLVATGQWLTRQF